MATLKNLLSIMLLLVLVGCTAAPKKMYEGERRAPEQEVRIIAGGEKPSAMTPGFSRVVYITKVDENSAIDVKAVVGGQTNPYPTEVFILPGRHTLDVKYAYMNTFARGKLWLDAEAGKAYVVRIKLNPYSVSFWIEDTTTGKPVGGIAGTEPIN